MKNHCTKFLFALLLLLFSKSSFAQSKIMDGRLDFNPNSSQYSGQVSLFLTDTALISSIKILVGSSAGDSDLYQSSYTIGVGGSFPGTIQDNVLTTSIGTFSFHANYYALLRVLLSNGQVNQIAIHSSN